MSAPMDFSDFDFSESMNQIRKGLILTPILHTYLFDAKFPEYSLHFKKEAMERAPDDMYHPSTHPLWHPRALYNYLAHPGLFPVEKKQYMSTLSITMGKVIHDFLQVCITDAGVMHEQAKTCTWPEHQKKGGGTTCGEFGWYDEELGERGHLDGLLDFSSLTQFIEPEKRSPVLEIKTTNDNFSKLTKIEDLDLETFKTKWPEYWAQVQRYMKGSNRLTAVVLMMETGYPWVMREFHVPYDYEFNARVDAKYLAVRMSVDRKQAPTCCLAKGCPAYELCVKQNLGQAVV